jgi:hypothetical protein
MAECNMLKTMVIILLMHIAQIYHLLLYTDHDWDQDNYTSLEF